MDLTAHELQLMVRATSFVQGALEATGKYPSREQLRKHLSCDTNSAAKLLHQLRGGVLARAEAVEKGHDKKVIRAVAELATEEAAYKSREEYLFRENARLSRMNAKYKLEVDAERRLRRVLAQGNAGFDEFKERIGELVAQIPDMQLPKTIFERPVPNEFVQAVVNGHTEDAVLLISDTHFSDRITSADTSGFPEYDLEIAGNRFGYVIRQAKQILTLHRAMYPIIKLHVPILGDIGNGQLHDSPQSNELFLPAQVHFSYMMLKFGIEDLLTLVDSKVIQEIHLYFSVGNHMRLDIHMPLKYQAQRTLDWLIYQLVIERFKDDPRVVIHQEMSPFIFEEIRGHRFCFCHGSQVGYRNSPDAQIKSMGNFLSLVRALFDSPEFRKKHGLQGATFSQICIGDIHVPVTFPRIMSNGSLNGQNELGVNWLMEPIPAGQWIFGVSTKHQQTWKYFIEATEIQRQDPNSYAVYAKAYKEKYGRV